MIQYIDYKNANIYFGQSGWTYRYGDMGFLPATVGVGERGMCILKETYGEHTSLAIFGFTSTHEYVECYCNGSATPDKGESVTHIVPFNSIENGNYGKEQIRIEGWVSIGTLGNSVGQVDPIYSDIPIFTSADDVKNYINTGNFDNAINKEFMEEGGTDFFLNVDEKNMTVQLRWNTQNDKLIGIIWTLIGPSLIPNIIPSPIDKMLEYAIGYIKSKFGESTANIICGTEQGEDYTVGFKMDISSVKNKITFEDVKYISNNGKNRLKITYNSDDDEGDGYDSKPDSGVNTDTDNPYTEVNKLSTTHMVTGGGLDSISNFVWGNDLFDSIRKINSSPLQNIVSIKAIPYKCKNIKESTPVMVGNVNTGVTGDVTPNGEAFYTDEIKIPKMYYSFLDYSPYTKIQIYVPFCGYSNLDPLKVIGKKIKVKIILDFFTGSMTACIFSLVGGEWLMVDTLEGNAGIDISISENSSGTREIRNIINLLRTSLTDGVVQGATNMVFDSILSPIETKTKGTSSPVNSSLMPNNIFFVILRPIVKISKKFNHSMGRVSMVSSKLSKLEGYTEIINPDLTGINCYSQEKEMLSTILQTGFFIRKET